MSIGKSAEDYLETILMLQEKQGVVRSVDVAGALRVSKPSVSVAMKKLREEGFVRMAEDNLIVLTESGLEIARRIYERHKILSRFFQALGVDEAIALEDACRIEHDISVETFEAILRHAEKFI